MNPAPDPSRFADLHPPLARQAALAEANRCLFCFDAPCAQACPTHIDVPRFIKKIASGNLPGSARTILEANILGASCARACPVQVLCEGACVLNEVQEKPIEIGRLQRFAMDAFAASGAPLPFMAGIDTGRSVALIGAGPASLACAAELRLRGIRAIVYDARPLPGGLNTYGIAEYKLPFAESLREIEQLRQLGVEFHFGTQVDGARLAQLGQAHDAIFLGIGLGAPHRLVIPGETLPGVVDALDFIADYKTGKTTQLQGRVAVVGAGNTAIDAAVAALRLGADEVYLVYRRGEAEMSAFPFEYAFAKQEGVRFYWHKQLAAIEGAGRVQTIRIRSASTGEAEFTVGVDLVVRAIGQSPLPELVNDIMDASGRIAISRATGQTANPKYFSGGDCTNGGREVVDAVADGKRAAIGIAEFLETHHADA